MPRSLRSWQRSAALLLLVALVAAPAAARVEQVSAEPTTARKAWDAVVLRPLGVVQVAVGTVLFVLAYPVAAAAGAGHVVTGVCIEEPVEQVFRRPLGEL